VREFQSPTLFKLRERILGKKIGSRPLSKKRDPDEGYDQLVARLSGAVTFFSCLRFAHVFTLLSFAVKA
jgi:hypothetical protein